MSRTVAPPRVLNIDDLRRQAKRRLPRVVFDYIDGGADRERTLGENRRAFEDVLFHPRDRRSPPGTATSPPKCWALDSSCRSCWRRSAAAACSTGAARKPRHEPPARPGTGYILSTLSGCRLEDVKAATTGAGMVPALSRRWARRGAVVDRTRQGDWLPCARRHHRHTCGGPAGSVICGTASRNCSPSTRCQMWPYVWQMVSRPQGGWRRTGATAD